LLSRRDAIVAAGAATAASLLRPPLALAADAGLAANAGRTGRFFGAAARIEQLAAEPDLRAAYLRECSWFVPEIAMLWNVIEPAEDGFAFEAMDGLARYASDREKKLRGHTLLWHLAVPDWATQQLRAGAGWDLIDRYFGAVIPRYGERIEQWEVVNEPIEPGYRSDGLRPSVFLDAFGPEYVGRALAQARTYAPAAHLMINEYGLEYDNQDERDRRRFLLKLLEGLRSDGAPLDVLGMQAHLDLRKGHVSASAIAAFCRAVNDLGLTIVVTELDVKESDYVATAPERDRLVGDEVRRYLDVVLSQRGVLGVTTWGLSDRHSWLEVTADDYARFPSAWKDGTSPGFNRGLPLDSSLRPTPMYFALRDALGSVRPYKRV